MLHAVGIALAAKIRQTGQVAMTSMGEGSSNQGDVHEGLNFAAIHKLPLILVVENNGYAISVPAAMELAVEDVADARLRLRHPRRRRRRRGRPGLLSGGARRRSTGAAPATARRSSRPRSLRLTAALVRRPADEVPVRGGAGGERSATRCRGSGTSCGRPACSTEELEARIAAEITAEVDDATDYAEARAGPDVDRDALGTVRGGLAVREPPTAAWVAASSPAARGALGAAGRMADASGPSSRPIRETLAEEMRRDESMIVLGEDVGEKGGVFLATDGLWAEFGDDRVIDTPLTESMIVGASIGAAVNGVRPIAEIQFADFIFPAFNQIVSEAARMRYRLEQRLRRAR